MFELLGAYIVVSSAVIAWRLQNVRAQYIVFALSKATAESEAEN